jgi:hypothetical protein
MGYAGMMNSFFQTSIVQHEITNFLFVALDEGMCSTEKGRGLLNPAAHCVQYPVNYKQGGAYGSKGFRQIVSVKNDVMLGIVEEGYSVLLSDADIVFFLNPIPELEQIRYSEDADMVIQYDTTEVNSGFMYLPPFESSRRFLVESILFQEERESLTQQKVIVALLDCWRKKAVDFKTAVLKLDDWPNGHSFHRYYGKSLLSRDSRHFAWDAPCDRCRIYHNNWILTEEGKMLRFREFLLCYHSQHTLHCTSTNSPALQHCPRARPPLQHSTLPSNAMLALVNACSSGTACSPKH